MPCFDPKLLRGRTLSTQRQVRGTRLLGKPDIPDEIDEKEIKGVGLEKMGDKLDKLIVRPLKKPKNIKFKL